MTADQKFIDELEELEAAAGSALAGKVEESDPQPSTGRQRLIAKLKRRKQANGKTETE